MRRIGSVSVTVALVALGLLVAPGPAVATTATFGFTGASQDLIVPAGVHSISVIADGAAGGGSFPEEVDEWRPRASPLV